MYLDRYYCFISVGDKVHTQWVGYAEQRKYRRFQDPTTMPSMLKPDLAEDEAAVLLLDFSKAGSSSSSPSPSSSSSSHLAASKATTLCSPLGGTSTYGVDGAQSRKRAIQRVSDEDIGTKPVIRRVVVKEEGEGQEQRRRSRSSSSSPKIDTAESPAVVRRGARQRKQVERPNMVETPGAGLFKEKVRRKRHGSGVGGRARREMIAATGTTRTEIDEVSRVVAPLGQGARSHDTERRNAYLCFALFPSFHICRVDSPEGLKLSRQSQMSALGENLAWSRMGSNQPL